MSPAVSSETELFGITTLQKIFRTVSAIESSPQSKPARGERSSSVSCDTRPSNGTAAAAATTSPVAVRNCCEANAGEDGPSMKNSDLQQVSNCGNCSKITMTTTNLRTTRRMSTSAAAAVAATSTSAFNSSVPVDQIDHAITIVSGLGDSNVGTPV